MSINPLTTTYLTVRLLVMFPTPSIGLVHVVIAGGVSQRGDNETL
jgi:hypothetical protein